MSAESGAMDLLAHSDRKLVGPATGLSGKRHVIAGEVGVGSQNCQVFNLCLSYQHPVKGIAVVLAQMLDSSSMMLIDAQEGNSS